MRFITLLVRLTMVMSSAANPLPGVGPGSRTIESRDDLQPISDKPIDNENQWCYGGKFKTVESAYEHWTMIGGSDIIDAFIQYFSGGPAGDPTDWLELFEKYAVENISHSAAPGCSVLQNDCAPGHPWTCHQYFESANRVTAKGVHYTSSWPKVAYWVFESVRGFHAMASEYYRQLQDATLITDLRIPEIIDDFHGNDDTTEDMIAWVSAAFSMLGSGLGPVPALGGGAFGMVSTILSNTVKNEDPITGEISSSLADAYASTVRELERTLKTVMGNADSMEDYEKLPAPRDDGYTSTIAKFFNTGAWLVEIDEPGVLQHLREAAKNLERKVAHECMVHDGFVLVISDKLSTEEECVQGVVGRQWIEWDDGTWYCVVLRRPADKRRGNVFFVQPYAEFFEKQLAKYGLENRVPWYRSIMDCALNGGEDRNMDINNLQTGTIPRCFFRMPVYKVKKEERCGDRNICVRNVELISD